MKVETNEDPSLSQRDLGTGSVTQHLTAQSDLSSLLTHRHSSDQHQPCTRTPSRPKLRVEIERSTYCNLFTESTWSQKSRRFTHLVERSDKTVNLLEHICFMGRTTNRTSPMRKISEYEKDPTIFGILNPYPNPILEKHRSTDIGFLIYPSY